VDAAVGYAANEPVQLRADGGEVTVIDIADYFNLVSNGLVVGDQLIATRPDVVGALVASLLEGIDASLRDPDGAFETALQFVPEAADPSVRERQRAVLTASLPYWSPATGGSGNLGAISTEDWERSQAFLMSIGLVDRASPIADLVDDRFVADVDLPPPPQPVPGGP
jgi:NitT/TauT family transport system substrate-binding protein